MGECDLEGAATASLRLVPFLNGELELVREGDTWCRCKVMSSKCSRCQATSCFNLCFGGSMLAARVSSATGVTACLAVPRID